MRFTFLKEGMLGNLFEENNTTIWIPELSYFHHKKFYENGKKFRIQRNSSSKPYLSGGIETINPVEVYKGSDHFVKMNMKNRAEFLCSFENIKNYPFGVQTCNFEFSIKGHSNGLTNMTPYEFDAMATEVNFTCIFILQFSA